MEESRLGFYQREVGRQGFLGKEIASAKVPELVKVRWHRPHRQVWVEPGAATAGRRGGGLTGSPRTLAMCPHFFSRQWGAYHKASGLNKPAPFTVFTKTQFIEKSVKGQDIERRKQIPLFMFPSLRKSLVIVWCFPSTFISMLINM